jgi:chromosome segregation ATPase
VELGCIREENNELKKNIEMQRDDFRERLGEQRKRSDEEFDQLQEEFEVLKIESSEAQRAGAAKVAELTTKLEVGSEAQGGHIDKLDQQLRAKIEECALQKQNIDQLNKQLDSLREELEKSKTTRKQFDEEWALSGTKTGLDSSQQQAFYDQAQCSKPMTDKAWRGDVRRTSNQEE